MPHLFLIFAMLLAAGLHGQLPTVAEFEQQYLFEDPPTPGCHASTIEELADGTLLAAWFGGTREGAKDVGIYASRREGENWSRPRQLVVPVVQDGDTLPCWNPVLFRSQRDRLYLFYKVGPNPREWFGARLISDDGGHTWSEPAYLPAGFLGPIRSKPTETEPGVILCGSSTESPATDDWRVHLERFREATGSWQMVDVPNPKHLDIIQPTFLQHGGDTLQILCRSKHNRLVESWSYDGGGNWTPADSLNILNPNAGADAVTLSGHHSGG
ncbi:MAG: sialidase family protein [Lewinella sp.]